ncbi:MAG: flagellar hook-associated protein FlgK [Paenibacillaceae bacterium]
MRSTFSGLEISKRALFAQQTALQTTGHNIANANTVGYSRQVVNLINSKPMEAPGIQRSNSAGQIGTGVEFDYIKRIRETFLDHQFYSENKEFGEWVIRKDSLEKLEAIVNEPSDTGVRKVIENFWNAWQVLTKEPENLTARAALKEGALALTDAFNSTSKQLSDLTTDLTENINVKVNEVNSLSSQITSLNGEIFRTEGLGNDANDLRDQRDLLVDQLSGNMNINVTETASGYTIRMGNVELVNGQNVTTTVTAASLQASMAAGDLNSGQFYGMLVSRDTYVASYQFQLDSMVKALVQGDVEVTLPAGSVVPDGTVINGVTYTGTLADRTLTADTKFTVQGLNGMHALGYTLDDPPQTGIPFFTLKDGHTEFNAESLTVNPDIVNRVANIAASTRLYDDNGTIRVVKGNNDTALLIAGFRTKKFDFDPQANGTPILTQGTFEQFFQTLVGQLGVQTQEAIRQSSNQQMLVEQVDKRRQSVSGVSLDEEMANMIKFQHAYNAAARAMTTFDQLLDKVINQMGIVGR